MSALGSLKQCWTIFSPSKMTDDNVTIFDKSLQKRLFALAETEILFCNIKNVAHKRATFGLIGAIYGGLYEKYRPGVNNPTPFLDCVSGRRM